MLNLDLSNAEASDFDVLPKGDYLLTCEEASVNDTKNGNGQYIKLKLKVKGPAKFENRVLFTNFNIQNTNPQAVEIGLGQLKTFMKTAGVAEEKLNSLSDVNDLIGLTTVGKVTVKNDSYGEGNEVKGFKDASKWKNSAPEMDAGEPLPF